VWHNILTKFHDVLYRRSSIINVISQKFEAVMLVLLMEHIFEGRRWTGLKWHDIRTKFHDDRLRNLSNITVIMTTIRLNFWYY
jgi:hypothetical protein